ncbi:MAG: Bifunctional protein FolD protein [Chlamydiales bacterium]|nr:Bifunctional protein FolD protein [Chlamydiales bacterium]
MILSGKEVAEKVHTGLAEEVASFSTPPGLAVVLIGNNPSSQTYVNMKRRACTKIGIHSFFHHLPASTSEKELIQLVTKLNHDPTVNGILVQLPLPAHIDSINVIQSIDPKKDVDGFHPVNLGKVLAGLDDGFVPCTPLGIKMLLDYYTIPVKGKNVVIAGRSAIVGKPLAALLMQNAPGCNATVTVVHSQTRDLIAHTRRADILIAAVGSPRFIRADMVKEGAVVIDVGIHREGKQIIGDVDFEPVERKCQAITPVPGGVGPMTVAMLLHNTVVSYQSTH